MNDSSDTNAATDLNPDADPEIAELLKFEPVERRFKREDGWTAPLQRAFIAELARSGSPGKACDALGKRRSGIDKVYKVAGAESFRAAWHRAVEIAEERAAGKIRADHSAIANQTPPFRDHRRSNRWEPLPEPEPTISEDQRWELIESIGDKFMRKVAAERQARLAGEIVAADFYLRQITFMEVTFDLASSSLGFDPREALAKLRRGNHRHREIVSTSFSDWLDESRRQWWAQEGEPERPRHPDSSFLKRHRSEDGDYCTHVDSSATGAMSDPARGFSKEQWARMTHEEQRAARRRQFAEDAEEQRKWESSQRRAYEERQRSDASS